MGMRTQILSLVYVFLCLGKTATAEEIVVTSQAGSGTGSLRQAIADSGDGDTISFAPPLAGKTITLGGSELIIENDITIDANSLQDGIVVSGLSESRVFNISAGAIVTIMGLTVSDGSTSGNNFSEREGGGILVHGDLTLRRCTVSENFVTWAGNGGGIAVFDPGRLTVENCEISGNGDSGVLGGRIFFGARGGGIYSDGGEVTILRSTIKGNSGGGGGYSGGFGGGVYSRSGMLTIISSRVEGNLAGSAGGFSVPDPQGYGGSGGGICSFGGTLIVDRTTISGNRTGSGGFTDPLNGGGEGGDGAGIFVSNGTVTISNSTVSGNRTGLGVDFGDFRLNGGSGGGIAIFGDDLNLAINNSTISGNSAAHGGIGNGLFFSASASEFDGTMTLNHVTVSENRDHPSGSVGGSGDGLFNLPGRPAPILRNSIVAGNASPGQSDISGAVDEDGMNLIDGDAGLSPLDDYGGDTETMLPIPGSAAVDGGLVSFFPKDQRETPRAGAPDLGAVEFQDSDLLRFHLRPISEVQVTESGILLRIPSVVDHSIGVEYSEDLTIGSWVELGNFFPSVEGSGGEFLDIDGPRHSRSSGFYRAFLRPDPEP